MRFRMYGPCVVGRKRKTPSGRVYVIKGMSGDRTIDVDPADVDFFLDFKGECCTGGKQPLFELVEGAGSG